MKSDIKALWESQLKGVEEVTAEIWDCFKIKCRDIIQFHSKRLNSIKGCQFRELQKQFNLKITKVKC